MNTNTSISRYKASNLTNSLPWGCWTVKVEDMLCWRPQCTQKQCFLFKSEGILPVQTFISAQGEFFEMIESSCLQLIMIVESTAACLTLKSVPDRFNSGRWRFPQSTVEERFGNFFLAHPGQTMKALSSNIPIQISHLLRKRAGSKDSENKDKGWKTRGKVQSISTVFLLIIMAAQCSKHFWIWSLCICNTSASC